MSLFTDIHHLPNFQKAVLTIGSFDGVHKGHKQILEEVVKEAKEISGESIVITFHPHPRKIIQPDCKLSLITSNKVKFEEIFKLGIDHIVVVPFSRDFSLLTAQEFIHDFLWEKFRPQKIVIGYDHHFGHDRSGNINLLEKELKEIAEVVEIAATLIDDAAVSSTKIRKAISLGSMEVANEMLGRKFSLSGIVTHGKKLGRKLGYPTANLSISDEDLLLPPKGVYAVQAIVKNKIHKAVMSIGHNPTVTDSLQMNYEVHIFDFDEDIYGEELTVLFHQKIRDEKKFDSLEELIEQIKKDEHTARSILEVVH